MQQTAGDRSLVNRMMRAARAEPHLYEEVERDVDATSQAALVVVIVAVAAGIGRLGDSGLFGLIFGILGAFVSWIVWSAITYVVGTTLFKTENTRVTLGEMLRTLGFAQSPGILNILGFLPVIGVLVAIAVGIWQLVLGIIAIRSAMDFSTGRAIGTAIVGWIVAAVISAVFFGLARALS